MVLQDVDSQTLNIKLDPRLVKDILCCHKEMEAAGKLPSRQQLAEYYRTFRNKFGPEQLALLDGEALLMTMHSYGTNNSLVYWLEFKNDEEFPGIFGGISGGSAYNYGLYYKKETDAWMSGTSHAHQEITVTEAIAQARQHRDELVRGCELLDHLPVDSNLAAYEQLQLNMSRVAPFVSATAWGHKYFSLLYPDKLDDFHNANYACYHLIKLLLPPPAMEGRYVLAPYFMHLAHTLQMPVNILTTVLNKRLVGKIDGYWRIGIARYDEDTHNLQDDWYSMQAGNFCALGAPEWLQVDDLSVVSKDEKQEGALLETLRQAFPDRKPAVINLLLVPFSDETKAHLCLVSHILGKQKEKVA